MCGFIFIFENDKFKSDARAQIQKINQKSNIFLRGPDENSYLEINEPIGKITLAHYRLHIQGLIEKGKQPCVDKSKKWHILFNGEIYNTPYLCKKLGIKYDLDVCDTDIVLDIVAKYGIEAAIYQIKGMYSFLIYDSELKKIHLFRDTYGQKPLYYGFSREKLVISSDSDVVRGFLNIKRDNITFESVKNYVSFGYNPILDESINNNIKIVPGGSLIEIDLNSRDKFNIEEYNNFVPNLKQPSYDFSSDSLSDLLSETLKTSFKCVYEENVPSAILLSGGIDSGLLTYFLSKSFPNNKINTLSACFPENSSINECDKLIDLPKMGNVFQHNIPIKKEEFLKELDRFYMNVDEPISDTAAIPLRILSKYAYGKFKVLYSGDGADEIFGGYKRYSNFFLKNLSFVKSSKNINKNYLSYLSLLKLSRLEIEMIIEKNKFFNDKVERDLIPMNIDAKQYLQKNIFIKSDRSSMMSSIEIRSPYLYEDIIYLASLFNPPRKLYDLYSGKKPIRSLASNFLGTDYILGKKKGFGIPFNEWIAPLIHSQYIPDLKNFSNKNKDHPLSKLISLEGEKYKKNLIFWWRLHTLFVWMKNVK